MRLSEVVRQRGIDAFTFDDFIFVGSKLSVDPHRLILVGGQAIETWGVAFGVPAPTATGESHPLTEDTDWLGSSQDAVWLCQLLGVENTELHLADVTDPGPNSAMAYLKRPGDRVVLMDFLKVIVGPTNSEVRKMAVPIMVNGIKLSVLHPVLCLHSRLANLRALPRKRYGNGPLQARWAIAIAEKYLLRLLDTGMEEGRIVRACHDIAKIAEFKDGEFCFLNFDLDPLGAVTPAIVERISGRFATDDWPRTLERIARRRDKWIEKERERQLRQVRSEIRKPKRPA